MQISTILSILTLSLLHFVLVDAAKVGGVHAAPAPAHKATPKVNTYCMLLWHILALKLWRIVLNFHFIFSVKVTACMSTMLILLNRYSEALIRQFLRRRFRR